MEGGPGLSMITYQPDVELIPSREAIEMLVVERVAN